MTTPKPAIPPDPPFALTEGERNNPLWQRFEKHLRARLKSHRRRNENVKLSEIDTAALRGQIAEAKYFIRLGANVDDDTDG